MKAFYLLQKFTGYKYTDQLILMSSWFWLGKINSLNITISMSLSQFVDSRFNHQSWSNIHGHEFLEQQFCSIW